MNKYPSLYILVIAIFSWFVFRSNVAMPGIYMAGGTAFTMYFPEDSVAYKKVQMANEKITIRLYPGYAVVKGTYAMYNTSATPLSFRMGYPVNGIYSGGQDKSNDVYVDSLAAFSAWVNGTRCSISQEPLDADINPKVRIFNYNHNWKIWQMHIGAKDTAMVEVFFIVNTNHASQLEGYSSREYNSFIYLLESGAVWKQPIVHGKFLVQLMGGLHKKDIHGWSEKFSPFWLQDAQSIIAERTTFTPTPEDNLIITYGSKSSEFVFESVLKDSAALYAGIDSLSKLSLPAGEPVKFASPFDLPMDPITTAIGAGFILAFVIVPLIILIAAFFILRRIWKKRQAAKN